ncbi:hypothetical protein [Nitrosopumilus sp.]|uniref:hypothetical protein n=1 Tax=Nitrosopumilus sp. TaxID=2024843 RepID=UPI00292F874E|nr:hypothetical protein [Nitrosopumilus sp.]
MSIVESVRYCGCNIDSIICSLEFDFGTRVNVCQKHEEVYCKKARQLGFDFKKLEAIYA